VLKHSFPGAFADKPELENGDKILLPSSALDTLTRLNIQYPMTFEIIAPNGRTHCSVLEFSAPEGTCYLPYWMMSNLALTEGKRIRVRNVSLPKATFVKFQPQSVDFLEISNPRAVLEHKLRTFSCVTVGDHLAFEYNGAKYYLAVKEVKPQDAACIIEADVNVDFDAPVGYVEPERIPVAPPKPLLPEVQKAKTAEDVDLEEAERFKAFTGTAARVDGKALKKAQMAAAADAVDTASVDAGGEGSSSSVVGASRDKVGTGNKNGGHSWGEAAGSIKAGNVAAERRATMIAAAEARAAGAGGGGSSSLAAGGNGSAPAVASKSPSKPGVPTKWSSTAKMGRFQSGGNKLN